MNQSKTFLVKYAVQTEDKDIFFDEDTSDKIVCCMLNECAQLFVSKIMTYKAARLNKPVSVIQWDVSVKNADNCTGAIVNEPRMVVSPTAEEIDDAINQGAVMYSKNKTVSFLDRVEDGIITVAWNMRTWLRKLRNSL